MNTGKILDQETGLYYYGARYLDPRTSRWLSGDPAIGEYVPAAGGRSSGLPNGGIYNSINLNTYHYTNNNPVKFVDPDGRSPVVGGHSSYPHGSGQKMNSFQYSKISQTPKPETPSPLASLSDRALMGTNGIPSDGPCLAMAYLGIAQSYTGKTLSADQVNSLLNDPQVYDGTRAAPAESAIKAGINALDSTIDTTKLSIRDERQSNIADPAAFATVRTVSTSDSSSGVHYQQGSNTGALVWDPLHGTIDKYDAPPKEIRNIYIDRIE